MMLRFAACFGMFSIMRDMHISPNTLPMKMYELSTYSFRHEQKGEVIGLKRLRAFTMPDMHTLCTDMPEALNCFEEQLAMGWQTGKDFGTTLVGVFRCTTDFYDEHEALGEEDRQATRDCPMLIEILSDRVHYWVAKIDLAAIDGQGRPIENPTVQIDVESSTRFNIKYHTEDGDGRPPAHPPLLPHRVSVERVICAILENISTQAVPRAPDLALARRRSGSSRSPRSTSAFAAEVCDRRSTPHRSGATSMTANESVGKKVREAGMDWVPYVVVVGDEEVASKNLTVTVRKKSQPNKPFKEQMTTDALIAAVRKDVEGKPFRPLYTPRKLSMKARYI